MLKLRHEFTGKELPTINIEKIVAVPESDPNLQHPPEPNEPDIPVSIASSHKDLATVVNLFAKYLLTRKGHQTIASDVCRHVYTEFPAAREILSRQGKLKGLLQECPYLTMTGAAHGGTYPLNLNADIYHRVMDS